MASLHTHSNGLDHQSHTRSHGKITKPRTRPAVVRPILKKLQSAHAERRSLDLDRAWDEQQDPSPQPGYGSFDHGAHDLAAGDSTSALYGTSSPAGGVASRGYSGYSAYSSVYSSVGSTASGHRSVRDVSFTLSSKDVAAGGAAGVAAGAAGGGARSIKFSPSHAHARSTSGTSHASVATSTASGRNSSFVHPFQQIPRTSTPPLSYANSVVSLDNSNSNSNSNANNSGSNNRNSATTTTTTISSTTAAIPISRNSNILPSGSSSFHGNGTGSLPGPLLDCSPTITEDGDLDPFAYQQYPSTASAASNSRGGLFTHHHPRRPSFGSQRTTSLSDGNQALRTANPRSNSGPVQRIVSSSVDQSPSELQLSSASSAVDTPLSTSPSQMVTTPSLSSPTPLSPLRNSLDMSGFRLRSRSEVDTVTRQEQVREARRKFEAKERAKEEKYTREQVRKRERAGNKEALRSQAQVRKGSFGTPSFGNASLSSSRNSSSIDARRPAMSRKSTGTATYDSAREKVDFVSRGYESVPTGKPPGAGQVQFEAPKRRQTAKRKTTGVWTAFMLWLRTRLLHIGRE